MSARVSDTRGGSSSSSPRGGESDDPGNKRKRKQRRTLSCAECRRLKLKCDRIVPCANCTKRSCADICPSGVRSTAKANADESSALKARLEALEKLLQPTAGPTHMPDTVSEPARKRVKKGVTVDPNPPVIIQTAPELPAAQAIQAGSSSFSSVNTVSTGEYAPSVYSSVRPSEQVPLRFDYEIPASPRSSPQQTALQSASSWAGITETNQVTGTAPIEAVPLEQSYGTLVISKTGGSKYYGHTAASEWLKEQEVQDMGDGTSPRPSRMPTPERRDSTSHLTSNTSARIDSFPFQTEIGTNRTAMLLSQLPSALEGRVLMDSYYRYFAWHFDVAPRSTLEPIFENAYAAKYSKGEVESKIDSHQLALLYIVLAMGARHSLELPQDDPSADDYMTLAKRSLAKSDFLTHCTIAAVQTLHIMAHYHLETEKGRNGDQAWPLWGMAMRLLQAMGLHRDGTRWNLAPPVIEERRRVFWECYSADVFQANCFSRPNSIALKYIDAAYPERRSSGDSPEIGARHDVLKFELSRLSSSVLDLALRVEAPPYSNISEVHTRLSAFEREIPYDLRCRDALLALPSVHPNAESAMRESPEVTRKDLPKTLQQYTLALNVTEAMLFLHRPYFAKALHERKPDPIQTPYGSSYLCVIERCNVMIQICAGVYRLHPLVVARHWHFWYHAFNAAVCMGTLILQNPQNVLASYALSLIDTAIGLHAHILQTNPTARLRKNLEWLLRLKQRAATRMESSGSEDAREDVTGVGLEEGDTSELIGWRTRLVERLGQGSQKATTITPTASSTTPSPSTSIIRTISQALQDHVLPSTDQLPQSYSSNSQDHATDILLHQFWDPMLMQEPLAPTGDEITNAEWWNWEPSS